MDELFDALMESAQSEGEESGTGAADPTEDYSAADVEYRRLVRGVLDDINTLTFNRITSFRELTEFQQDIFMRACNRLIRFRQENAEMLNTMLSSYSVNGVSMGFDSARIKCINGIYIPGDIYALLQQTGLTCRVI